jgi:hypothetical protein
MKAFTDISQSKKLAEILPMESADMRYDEYTSHIDGTPKVGYKEGITEGIPCLSLAALLNYIKDKCGYFELVYLNSTFDGRANKLENVYRLSTDVYDIYEKEAVDACVEMILKLNELKLL